ncbi:Proteasome subunit beta type-2-A [Bienertia sinuspersici]
MECVFGLVGDGFAVIAADTSAVNSILVHKTNEDKVMILDSHKLMGASGEPGDRVQFTEFIQKNVSLYQFRNGIPLTTAAAANFTRGELATALRKVSHSFSNRLGLFDLLGYDSERKEMEMVTGGVKAHCVLRSMVTPRLGFIVSCQSKKQSWK